MKKLIGARGVAAALLAGLLVSLACGGSGDGPERASGGISVSGSASISLKPDIATLVLGVEAIDESVARARGEAAEAMAGIAEELERAGIAEKDIQTLRLSIRPEYDYGGETRRLIGFSVSNIVNITIRDIDSVGAIIDRSVEVGGDLTRVQSIQFSTEDRSEYEKELVEEAVKDATEKAQRLADLAGVRLGEPVSISYGGGSPYPAADDFAGLAMAESAAFDTPVSPGEVEASVRVSILFSIE